MLEVQNNIQTFAGDGVIQPWGSTVFLDKATAATMTIPDPAPAEDGTQVLIISSTAAAHTISGTINGSAKTATFTAAAYNWIRLVAVSGGWVTVGSLNATVA